MVTTPFRHRYQMPCQKLTPNMVSYLTTERHPYVTRYFRMLILNGYEYSEILFTGLYFQRRQTKWQSNREYTMRRITQPIEFFNGTKINRIFECFKRFPGIWKWLMTISL